MGDGTTAEAENKEVGEVSRDVGGSDVGEAVRGEAMAEEAVALTANLEGMGELVGIGSEVVGNMEVRGSRTSEIVGASSLVSTAAMELSMGEGPGLDGSALLDAGGWVGLDVGCGGVEAGDRNDVVGPKTVITGVRVSCTDCGDVDRTVSGTESVGATVSTMTAKEVGDSWTISEELVSWLAVEDGLTADDGKPEGDKVGMGRDDGDAVGVTDDNVAVVGRLDGSMGLMDEENGSSSSSELLMMALEVKELVKTGVPRSTVVAVEDDATSEIGRVED